VVDHKTYRDIADEYGLDWETIRKIVRKQKPK
jgi:predicted DsbA family dithiol-disulfide isomerase